MAKTNRNQPLGSRTNWLILVIASVGLTAYVSSQIQSYKKEIALSLNSIIAKAAGTATISMSPTSASVGVNQTFTANIILNTGGNPADGVDIYSLRFNPAVLQVNDSDGVAAGTQIAPGALMPNTIFNTVDNTNGTIQFAQSTTGGTSFTGSGTLATITFRGIAGGTSTANFDFTLGSTSDTNVSFQGVDQLASVTNANYTVDSTAPSAPSSLITNVVSSTQINLSWTPSTDNVGVTGYQVERCSGSTCSTFAQIGTPAGSSYNDTGLSAGTTYRYRVRATDAASNLSSYSTIVNATTSSSFDFTMSNSGNVTVSQGSNGSNTITVTLAAGSTQSVSLSASGLPTGVTSGFSPSSCSPTCTSTLTLSAQPTASTGAATVTVTGSAAGITHTTTFTLTVNTLNYSRTISIASLEGRSGKAITGTVDVLNSGKSLIKSYTFTTNSSGTATITFDIPTQVAYLKIHATPFLTRLLSGVDLSVNTTYAFPQLLIGDINQDNIINSVDYSVLNTNWFTSSVNADLNQDGVVNSIDYSYMNQHWLLTGEQ